MDIKYPALHRYDHNTGEQRMWPMPDEIGSFALRRDGGAIVALRSGLFRFDFGSESFELISRPEADRPHNQLNDGKTAPDGRFFFFGSLDRRADKTRSGALYRLGADGRCDRVADGYLISNGLAWSPDGRRMYHSDSRAMHIDVWDYEPETGGISNRRTIARPGEAEGRPDGAATDLNGRYWSAGVSAGRLNRFSPDGVLEAWIEMPVPTPTMPCFAGSDLKTLYVTSLQRLDAPHDAAGALFRLAMNVPGVAVPLFCG